MGVINAASVSQGLLTPAGPQHWHAASREIKEAASKANKYCQVRQIIKYSEHGVLILK